MEKDHQIFLKLVKHISLNNTLFNNMNFLDFSNVDNKDTILKLFTSIEEIESYYKTDKLNTLKIIYSNRNSIKTFLYKFEESINLTTNNNAQNLSYYFYSTLLINYNESEIDYIYSIYYIKDLNELMIKTKEIYKKLIMAKIIIKLIDAYNQFDNDEENNVEIEQIKEDSEKIINDNINIFNLKKINEIDSLYIKIIVSLIQNNKFEDYEYIYNIINQLDLENIDINEFMFDRIKEALNKEKNYMSKYLITKKEDLFNRSIINFYLIITKYILKDSIFLYQIDLLLNLRKFIIKLIKSKTDFVSYLKVSNNLNDDDIKHFDYLIEKFTDSKYYKNQYIKLKDGKNQNLDLDSNIKVKDETNNKNNEFEESDSKINGKIFIVEECSSESEDHSSNNSKEEDSIDDKNNDDGNDNESNSYSNIKKSSSQSKSIISEEIIQINNKSSSGNDNINMQNNIKKQIILKSNNSNNLKINNSSSSKSNYKYNRSEKDSDCKMYKITEYENIIGNHKIEKKDEDFSKIPTLTADKIYEMREGFASMGANNIINIYNKSYKKVMDIKQKSDFAFSICEMEYQNKILTLIPFKAQLNVYNISLEDKKFEVEKNLSYKNSIILFLLKESNNNYFICCKDNIKWQDNMFKRIFKQEYGTLEIASVKSGLKLNQNIIVFKSCSIKNSFLKFYNCLSKIIINTEIKGYSLLYSTNGLSVIPRKEINSKNIYLLCACKKYNKNQKNGILLVNLYHNYNKLKMSKKFFNTKNFEIFCFCPILIKVKTAVLKNQYIMEDTNYFLVGGFQKDKCQGMIKVYKIVKYGEEYYDAKIEYIQDIILESFGKNNFNKFKKPISDIIQSKIDGNILITCWDGNVYKLLYPNIEYYLENDEIIEKNISFEEFFKC